MDSTIRKWLDEGRTDTTEKFMKLLKVYVDKFIAISQPFNVYHLHHISLGLLEVICEVFPPPAATKHPRGDIFKKLKEKEYKWNVWKEILGYVFDGCACII